jgi:hypothetical protein
MVIAAYLGEHLTVYHGENVAFRTPATAIKIVFAVAHYRSSG